ELGDSRALRSRCPGLAPRRGPRRYPRQRPLGRARRRLAARGGPRASPARAGRAGVRDLPRWTLRHRAEAHGLFAVVVRHAPRRAMGRAVRAPARAGLRLRGPVRDGLRLRALSLDGEVGVRGQRVVLVAREPWPGHEDRSPPLWSRHRVRARRPRARGRGNVVRAQREAALQLPPAAGGLRTLVSGRALPSRQRMLAFLSNIGLTELLVIAVIAVLIFGKDLPQAASKAYLQAR